MRVTCGRAVAVLFATCLLLSNRAIAEQHPLHLRQFLDWERVENPQISPDDKRVIYTRWRVDKLHDRWVSGLWIVNMNGSDDRYFGTGSSPQWSPDGTKVAYLDKATDGSTQIFVRRLEDVGDITQVTHVQRAPDSVTWSPDSRTIAFTMFVPASGNQWKIDLPERPEGALWTEDPRVLTRLVYRIDRLNYVEDGYFQIFTVPVSGGVPAQLTTGEFDHGGGSGFGGNLSWTPDGNEIVFSSFHTEDWEYIWRRSDVYAVNVRTKSLRQLTTRDGPDQDPAVSPDGRWIAFTGFNTNAEAYTVPVVYVEDIQGRNPRPLTLTLDRSPYSSPYGSSDWRLYWAPDSSGVYFNIDDSGTRNLYFASVSGAVKQITRGNHVLTVTSVNAKSRVAAVLSTPSNASDIVIFDAGKPAFKQLTFVNDDVLRDTKLGSVEELWYDSVDGFRIQGWIVKPPEFNASQKYPLVLAIHGGPHAMYDVGFNFAFQEFAAKGYVVLYTNPRGSTGYGGKFANAIKNAYPGKDFDDLMKGVDAIVSRGFIDPERLYVQGCSGGGVLTAWIVGHTDRFAAASANCAVTNWISFVGTTDAVEFYDTFLKRPWEDPSEYQKRSPLMYVGNVKTPTMLMTGELDLDTPIGQAEEFYRALKLRGIPTALVRFNDEPHGTTSKPSNFLRTQLYLQYWFNRYMRAHTPAGISGTGQSSIPDQR